MVGKRAVARFSKRPGFYKVGLTVALYWLVLTLFVFEPPALPVSENLALAILLISGLPIQVFTVATLGRNANAEASELAFRDELTGLKNRRAFISRAEHLFERAAPGTLSLLVLDVDGLKSINDECGHSAGDELLGRVASELKQLSPDAFRIGGDEFTVLIDRSQRESMTQLLRRLKPIEHSFRACGHDHWIEFSYGVASLQADEAFEAVFRRADSQMRQLKTQLHASAQHGERHGRIRALRNESTDELIDGDYKSPGPPAQVVPIRRRNPSESESG